MSRKILTHLLFAATTAMFLTVAANAEVQTTPSLSPSGSYTHTPTFVPTPTFRPTPRPTPPPKVKVCIFPRYGTRNCEDCPAPLGSF